jgi:hypothetical protein
LKQGLAESPPDLVMPKAKTSKTSIVGGHKMHIFTSNISTFDARYII